MRKCTRCENLKSESAFYDYTHERRCKECISEIRKAKYAENPEPTKARGKVYRFNNPDAVKDSKLRQDYGMSLEEYNQILAEQGGVCAICKKPETAVWRGKILSLAVDHNHTTKVNRGLLCMKCNRALGLLEENIGYLISMIRYIWKYLK